MTAEGDEPVGACAKRSVIKKGIVAAVAVCLLGTMALAQASRSRTATGDGLGRKTGDTRVFPGEKGWKLTAYYFHAALRCGKCATVEKRSQEAVEGDFAEEIRAGKVVFVSLNFQEPDNQHFWDDYRLTFRSLVLSLRKDGAEVKWKNLPEIWTRVYDPAGFRGYVSGEVKAMLREMN